MPFESGIEPVHWGRSFSQTLTNRFFLQSLCFVPGVWGISPGGFSLFSAPGLSHCSLALATKERENFHSTVKMSLLSGFLQKRVAGEMCYIVM